MTRGAGPGTTNGIDAISKSP